MKHLVPLSALLMLAACGDAAETTSQPHSPVAQVRTAVATLGTTRDDLTVYGAAEVAPGSVRTLVVPSEAIVGSVDAANGAAVRAGQRIMTLLPSPPTRIEANRADSDALVAESAYQRALRLRKDGLVSDADVETARGAARAAHTAVTGIRVGVNGFVLSAPIAGAIQGLTARPGDEIAAGTTVVSVVAGGALRARFGVDPAVAQRIRVGQPIAVAAIAGSAPFATRVDGIDAQIDATTRQAAIYARVPPGAIGAGEPLRGTITVGGSAQGVTIPYAALLDDGGRSYVFVVARGTARRRAISPGNSAGDRIQILDGLAPGERVVIEGGTALDDDMKVRERAAPPSGGAGG